MTDHPFPTAICPTCATSNPVSLPEDVGARTTVLCSGCGKILHVERGSPTQVVVREQITPMIVVTPPGDPPA